MSLNNPAIVIGVSAVDNAKGVLEAVDRKISILNANVTKNGTNAMFATSKQAEKMKKDYTSMAMSAATLTAGIVSFATSFDMLEKAQVKADRAALMYSKSVETLKNLQESGKASSEQLANAQEQVRINLEKTKLAQDDLGDTYANFLATMPLQMLSFGTSFVFMMTAMRTSTTATTGAMNGFKIGSIAAFLTNPVGIAIIGISALVLALAFNVGGLRDAVFNLGKGIYEFLQQHFKPLADGLKWFYDNVLKPIGDFIGKAMPQEASAMSASFDDVAVSTQRASKEVQTYAEYLADVNFKTKETRAENEAYLRSIGQIEDATGIANEKLEFAADYMRDLNAEAKSLAQENFNLVASQYGLTFAMAQSSQNISLYAQNLKEYTRLLDEAANSTDNLDKKTRSAGEGIRGRAVAAGLISDKARHVSGTASTYIEQGIRKKRGGFTHTSKRGAQSGMFEYLTEDTEILAHAGEFVNITPKGGVPAINITIVQRGDKIEDVEVRIGNKRIRQAKTERQRLVE